MPDYSNYNLDRSKKICFACKDMLHIDLFRIREKKKGRGKGKYINNTCKQCEDRQVTEYRRTDRGIAAEIVRRTKSVCKKESLPHDLDKDWVLNKLNSIGWRCELTRYPFNAMRESRSGFHWDALSVDRLNPKGGYTKNNVRFILNQINVFRQDCSDEQMYALAKALLECKGKEHG